MWRKILGARCNFTKHPVKPSNLPGMDDPPSSHHSHFPSCWILPLCPLSFSLQRIDTIASPLLPSSSSHPSLSRHFTLSPADNLLPLSVFYSFSLLHPPKLVIPPPRPPCGCQPYCLLWTRVARLPQVCIETWIFQMEEQFILRVPPSVAERIERLLNENASSSADGALDISFSGNPSTGYLLISWSKFWKIILCTSNDRW